MALDEAKVAALALAFAPEANASLRAQLAHFEAIDCSAFRFDHNGQSRRRVCTFAAEIAFVVKEQVGSGKSRRSYDEVLQVVAADPEAYIVVAVPTTALAEQAQADLEAITGLQWRIYRGFESKVEGVPICMFIEQAEAARRIGLDPYETLCLGCPHQDTCALWGQYTSRARLWIVTHAQLRHGLKPFDKRAAFDLIIIDEDPTPTLLASEPRDLSLLINVRCGDKTRTVLKHVHKAATAALDAGGRIQIQDLPRPNELRSAATSLRKKPSFNISRAALPDGAAVAGAEARLQAAALLDDLIDAMAMKPGTRGEVAGCMVREKKGDALAIEIAVAREIHPQFTGAVGVQVLSATAAPLLLERSIPNILLDEKPWQPYQHGKFVFVQDAKVSKLSLLDGDRLAQGGLEALEVTRTLARRHERLFLACQKPVLEALAAAGLPSNVATRNFGALEGLNEAAQFDAILILGRPLPPDVELILNAEAAAGGFIDAELVWTDKEGKPQPTFGNRVTLERSASDGSNYTAYAYRNENSYLDAMRQASTFAAVTQADRSRGQHRTPDNPVTIYDATGLDNVWQIDEVVHWRSLCGWFGAMEAMGFVPHPDAAHGLNELLAELLPEIFPDAKAVENHRVYAKRMRGITLETLVAGCPFRGGVVVNIKLPAARYGVPVIVNADNAPDAADLIGQHLPPGTKISTKARHSLRLAPTSEKGDHR